MPHFHKNRGTLYRGIVRTWELLESDDGDGVDRWHPLVRCARVLVLVRGDVASVL
jgi:hypothetical protein